MQRVNNLEEFRRLLHVTVICAPDKFPVRDFLKPEDQLNLESAFRDLIGGLIFVEGYVSDTGLIEVKSMLESSLISYRNGQAMEGAHFLQDAEDLVFGKPSYRP